MLEEIGMNMAYRWFIGYPLNEQVPHFSTVSYNFKESLKKHYPIKRKIGIIEIASERRRIAMHQEIFSDIEYSFRKKKTKREEFRVMTPMEKHLLAYVA